MDVSLPPELERYVSERVSAGDYGSASEVIREGLRLLRKRDAERFDRVTELRSAIDEGLAAAKRSEVVGGDEAFAQLRQAGGRRKTT